MLGLEQFPSNFPNILYSLSVCLQHGKRLKGDKVLEDKITRGTVIDNKRRYDDFVKLWDGLKKQQHRNRGHTVLWHFSFAFQLWIMSFYTHFYRNCSILYFICKMWNPYFHAELTPWRLPTLYCSLVILYATQYSFCECTHNSRTGEIRTHIYLECSYVKQCQDLHVTVVHVWLEKENDLLVILTFNTLVILVLLKQSYTLQWERFLFFFFTSEWFFH